ncbi:MAG: copper amine oxidase N-terminal domain-containing protein [Defluviitaleaceae bacterium]|nr:copper amine oxidase N-terminal domain-containing protein [Defluviitaleaceae bacterium]
MKRHIFRIILAVLLVFLPATAAFADFHVILDDEPVQIAMEVRDGRTLVPVRAFVEGVLGGEVSWDGYARRVDITHAHNSLVLHIDSDIALINDNEVTLDVPAMIIDGATLVPLRFVTEALGMDVAFADGTISITSGHIQIINFPYTVQRGIDATLEILGRPLTYYHLGVEFMAGPSTAAGLGYALSDEYGNVYWIWRIGSTTTPGSWPVTIVGGGEILTLYFQVME